MEAAKAHVGEEKWKQFTPKQKREAIIEAQSRNSPELEGQTALMIEGGMATTAETTSRET